MYGIFKARSKMNENNMKILMRLYRKERKGYAEKMEILRGDDSRGPNVKERVICALKLMYRVPASVEILTILLMRLIENMKMNSIKSFHPKARCVGTCFTLCCFVEKNQNKRLYSTGILRQHFPFQC